MADFEVSTGAAAAALDGTEEFGALQGGVPKVVTSGQVKTLANTIATVLVSADTTLDSSYYGKLIVLDTTGTDLTFPAAPATVEVIDVLNISGGNCTANGVALASGKRVTFASYGSAWRRLQPQQDVSTAINTMFTGFKSGRYYPTQPGMSLANGPVVNANKIYFEPFILPADMTVSEIAGEVRTAAGTVGYFAIYANTDTGTDYRPTGAPIAQGSGSVSTATTGAKNIALVSNVTLTGGTLYWMAAVSDGAVSWRANGSLYNEPILGSASVQYGGVDWLSLSTVTPGTWPTSPSLSLGNACIHALMLRAA